MTDATMLRRIMVVGPRLAVGDEFLWRAELDTVYKGRGPRDVVDKTFGIRLVLAGDPEQDLVIYPNPTGSEKLRFRPPALLVALTKPGGAGTAWVRPRTGSGAYVLRPLAADAIDTVLLSPATEWPAQARYKAGSVNEAAISLPHMRIGEGRIQAFLERRQADDPGPLQLSVANGQVSILKDLIVGPSPGSPLLKVDLTAQGLEFKARAPRGLTLLADLDPDARLTYRLVTVARKGVTGSKLAYELHLIDAHEWSGKLQAALSSLFTSTGASPVSLGHPAGHGSPRLRWRLLEDAARQRLSIDPYEMWLPAGDVAVTLLTDAPSLRAPAQVGTLAAPETCIRLNLAGGLPAEIVMRADTGPPEPYDASAPLPMPDMLKADVRLDWSTTDGLSGKLEGKDAKVALNVDYAELAERLGALYTRAGVQPPERASAPFTFMPIERGWLQLPLPEPAPDPSSAGMSPKSRARDVLGGGVAARPWKGAPEPDDAVLQRRIEVEGCLQAQLELTWRWTERMNEPTAVIRLLQAWGWLRGFVFVAAASPSPLEILPTLLAGPAATRDVDMRFGVGIASEISARIGWNPDGKGLELVLDPLPSPEDVWSWESHPEMPLIAAVPMTRTVASGEPSLSRGLIPNATKTTKLTLEFSYGKGRPKLVWGGDPKPTEWPWPKLEYDGPSADEPAGVPLTCPTLPDMQAAWPSFTDVTKAFHVSLAFDPPLLWEFFAGVRTPRAAGYAAAPDLKGAPRPATSLEPARLARVWCQAAEGLALARTQAAILVPWTAESGGDVRIEGLSEPFVWETTFRFDRAPAGLLIEGHALNIGGFALNGEAPLHGTAALAGGADRSFAADRQTGRLTPVVTGQGDILVRGLAASERTEGALQYDNRGYGLARVPETLGVVRYREAAFDPGPANENSIAAAGCQRISARDRPVGYSARRSRWRLLVPRCAGRRERSF